VAGSISKFEGECSMLSGKQIALLDQLKIEINSYKNWTTKNTLQTLANMEDIIAEIVKCDE
jgi:hypothetical protein